MAEQHLPTTEQIAQAVDRLQDEAVRLLSDIVRFDSTLGNENPVQEYMAKTFADLGLEVSKVPIVLEELKQTPGFSPVDWEYNGKFNVVGAHKPKEVKGKSVIFNGHVDVVPTGPAHLWASGPFDPQVREGRLYGRGAGDMKAGVAAFCIAFRALRSLGVQPAAPVYLQTVVEEECTGNGALAVSQKSPLADAVIIPEPLPGIVSAQLGVMWLQVHLHGRPAHVLNTSAGVNSIEAAFYLFDSLRPLEAKWNAPENRPEAYKNFAHPINFNLGIIHGGDWASSVPCECQFDVRVAFFPGVKIADAQKEIEDTLAAAAAARQIHYTVSYSGFQAEGCDLDVNSNAIQLLAKCHKQIYKADVPIAPVTCTTDARFFQLYHNIPTTSYGPEATNIHGIDESVSLDSMHNITKVLAVFMAEWCRLERV